MKKAVSATTFHLFLALMLMNVLTLAVNIEPVKADYTWTETIYIRADGSVEPLGAPLSTVDNITYTLTDNITGNVPIDSSAVIVERDNIVVDGAGYTVQGIRASVSKGIDLSKRSNVTIRNMEIRAFYYGIYLWYSSNNSIVGNNIATNIDGIYCRYNSKYNTFSGNNITNNQSWGIELQYSSNNVFRNNTMVGNRYNFGVVAGSALSHFIHDMDVSNTVDGKLVYYLINQKNLLINSSTYPNVGYLALVNSTNITMKGLELKNNGNGMLFAYTSNSQITNNNITNNEYGIYLYESSNNSITGNSIPNDWFGIWLRLSSNNIISGNNITNGAYGIGLIWSSEYNTVSGNSITASSIIGIRLTDSLNNSICGNNITNNSYGLYLDGSSNNSIYHNNIINNTDQACISSDSLDNIWDDGYPFGGNYWSDYNGTDLYSGPYQNETGIDGLGDTVRIIDENNTDRYPLVYPFGHNMVCNPSFEVDEYPVDGFPDCWILISNYPTDYYLDDGGGMFGNSSLKMEIYCTPSTPEQNYTYGAGAAVKWFHAKPDTAYTASYYVKTDRPEDNFALLNSWEYDANGPELGQHFQYFPLTTGWQRINFTFTTYPTTSMFAFNFAIHSNFNKTVTEWKTGEMVTAWIDGCQLEEGDTAKTFNIYFEAKWPYDVNGDNYCGIDDIVAVAEHFSFEPPNPLWDQKYDVNCDQYVGIDDIVAVAEHFGEEA